MLPYNARVRLEKDFQRVFSRGRSMYAKTIGIRYVPTRGGNVRFGFLVSNKVSKKATARNLVKRRLRAAAAGFMGVSRGSYDVVVLTKPSAVGMSYKELAAELGLLLKRTNIV